MLWPFALLFFVLILLIPKQKERFRDLRADEQQGLLWIPIGIFILILVIAFLISFA